MRTPRRASGRGPLAFLSSVIEYSSAPPRGVLSSLASTAPGIRSSGAALLLHPRPGSEADAVEPAAPRPGSPRTIGRPDRASAGTNRRKSPARSSRIVRLERASIVTVKPPVRRPGTSGELSRVCAISCRVVSATLRHFSNSRPTKSPYDISGTIWPNPGSAPRTSSACRTGPTRPSGSTAGPILPLTVENRFMSGYGTPRPARHTTWMLCTVGAGTRTKYGGRAHAA